MSSASKIPVIVGNLSRTRSSEKEIELSIIGYIRAKGWWCQKLQSGAVFSSYTNRDGESKQHQITLADEGSPDIVACIEGRFFGIEVKKSKNEMDLWFQQKDQRSQSQKLHLEKIDECGGVAIITYSLDDFILLMEQSLKENT